MALKEPMPGEEQENGDVFFLTLEENRDVFLVALGMSAARPSKEYFEVIMMTYCCSLMFEMKKSKRHK